MLEVHVVFDAEKRKSTKSALLAHIIRNRNGPARFLCLLFHRQKSTRPPSLARLIRKLAAPAPSQNGQQRALFRSSGAPRARLFAQNSKAKIETRRDFFARRCSGKVPGSSLRASRADSGRALCQRLQKMAGGHAHEP